ncbi:uncharacterized protein [Drosophila kikkawai]|uniref:Endonuclease/exonuclease/phosphatase domain-containing protein n=1 Tax=Drosophila kikkawai TaxID=30033 RepID=A0ABM4GHZ1_DROKI
MKILQANMHRSRTANDLLHQIVLENQIDVVIISEEYKKREEGFWLEDDTKTAAIWIPDPTTAPQGRNVGTIPDITLVTENCAHKIADWKVLDTYNGSDHCYIMFDIAENEVTTVAPTRKGWNANRLDKEMLIREIYARLNRQRGGNIISNNMTTIRQACKAAIPKMGNPRRQGQEAYWWTQEIKALRETCIKNRRRLTRARRKSIFTQEESQFKKSKKDLNIAIRKTKTEKWKRLCNDVNSDPWGLGYKIVMKKLRKRNPTPDLEEEQMDQIVKALFPAHTNSTARTTPPIAEHQIELFTEDELLKAAKTLKREKGPMARQHSSRSSNSDRGEPTPYPIGYV